MWMAARVCAYRFCTREIVGRRGNARFCSQAHKEREHEMRSTERIKAQRACHVDGCTRGQRRGAHGFCDMHYRRWRLTGDPGPAEPQYGARGDTCSMEDCGKPVRARDL